MTLVEQVEWTKESGAWEWSLSLETLLGVGVWLGAFGAAAVYFLWLARRIRSVARVAAGQSEHRFLLKETYLHVLAADGESVPQLRLKVILEHRAKLLATPRATVVR